MLRGWLHRTSSQLISLDLRQVQQGLLCKHKIVSHPHEVLESSCSSNIHTLSGDRYYTPETRTNLRLKHIKISAANRFASNKRKLLKVTVTPLDSKFKMEWPKITCFGDSITRRSVDPDNGCWASMIDYKLGDYFDLDVRGFEGYNSALGLELMPKLFPRSYLEKVEIFIPFFGHNDSWHELFPMALPPDEYEKNMRGIIKYLEENGLEKSKIVMITPAWYHDESFLEFLRETKMPAFGKKLEHAQKYGEAVLRIAKDNNLDVVDFFEITRKQDPLKEIFCDGVHLSRKGARLLYDVLMPVIQKKIEYSLKKPLSDLWHAIPFEQHPLVKPILEAHRQSIKKD